MRTIHKYEIKITDRQTIKMPKDAIILSVGNQRDAICLWAMVETDAPIEVRKIQILGTGHAADNVSFSDFIGTVLTNDHVLVWHVFEDNR